MTNMTTNRLLNMYNAAAVVLEEKPVKKFTDRDTTETRTTAILARLSGRQVYRDPAEVLGKIRVGSIAEAMITALDTDDGITEEALAAVLVAHYATLNKQIKEPVRKLHSVLNHLRRTKGMGFRRIGNRFWLVS